MRPPGSVNLSGMVVKPIEKPLAVDFVRKHHSALPNVQRGPWQRAFGAWWGGELVAAALWHNPSARGLPQGWGELRRMAISGSAPPNTASKMLAEMARQLRGVYPRIISYQDAAVHNGTIYRAAGWVPTHVSKPRSRDRSATRKGSRRRYRTDMNGLARAASAKVRWEKDLSGERLKPLDSDTIAKISSMEPTK